MRNFLAAGLAATIMLALPVAASAHESDLDKALSHVDLLGTVNASSTADHSVGYGVAVSVAKLGPVRIAPMGEYDQRNGHSALRVGVAGLVRLTGHLDVGVAAVSKGSVFEHGPALEVVAGLRL